MIVIDASATIALILNEDAAATSEGVFRTLGRDQVFVPNHWPAEVGNALVSNVRRRRLDRDKFEFIVHKLDQMNIQIEAAPSLSEMGEIARTALDLGLSYYDAAYVDKARSRQALLFTFDQKMRQAASQLNVPLLPA